MKQASFCRRLRMSKLPKTLCWLVLHLSDPKLCQGFSTIALLTFFDKIILPCPMHCKMFSSTLDLYPLHAYSKLSPPSCDSQKNISRHCQMCPRVGVGTGLPLVENHCLSPEVNCQVPEPEGTLKVFILQQQTNAKFIYSNVILVFTVR